MHLHVILCFAVLIWWPGPRPFEPLLTSPGAVWACVWVQVPLFWMAAAWASRMALARLDRSLTVAAWSRGGAGAVRAQTFYHWATFALRSATVVLFLGVLFGTDWLERVRAVAALSIVPGADELLVLMPFFASCVAIFVGLYPIDRAIHRAVVDSRAWEGLATVPGVWNLPQYLNFNLRHHLLVVAAPMMVVLVAFDVAKSHEDWLGRVFRVTWAAEAVPALAAGAVFAFAPLMLRHIWSTRPLPDGPLRQELEGICRRIGLPFRDILVWHSGGMMVNAAVMGLFRQVRYVLLSDGLLEAMSRKQVEAVFGHEAGHVRHRHIHYFLLFAVCSMLLLSAVIEALRLGAERDLYDMHVLTVQGLGLLVALVFWGIGFGWISRRFERQADVFGAHCVTPRDPWLCQVPCSIHGHDPQSASPPAAVCASAAALFVSALNRVAILNGIPPEERSWRHSSIATRVRFLISLTGDPGRSARFGRTVRRVKRTLLLGAVGGTIVAAVYIWDHPIYGIRAGVTAAAAEQTGMKVSHARPSH